MSREQGPPLVQKPPIRAISVLFVRAVSGPAGGYHSEASGAKDHIPDLSKHVLQVKPNSPSPPITSKTKSS